MSATVHARPSFATLKASLLSLAALLPAAALAGGGGWNETTQGDLPNDGLTPAVVAVAPGSNTFQGLTGRDATTQVVDRDYFTVSVPAGYELSSMIVLSGTMSIGGGSFIGLASGSTVTTSPTSGSAVGLLGWSIFSEDNIGSDLLQFMSIPGLGSTGFTPPLPAGTYSVWVQETGIGVATYAFTMDITPVTAVPEPATALTLLAGLGLLAGAARRR